eukprot:comp20976_c0_seq1/m.28090 comp20976_c0_seq1/g.28090  ORF comp20976_c0_seq1/g.28090 comp20976_c0_seq1/m.28090 type:complete len:155 (-) comp20976_c0_seq1:769-1233(-)
MAGFAITNLMSIEAFILYGILLCSIISFATVADCPAYPYSWSGGKYQSGAQFFVACGVMSFIAVIVHLVLLLMTIRLPGHPFIPIAGAAVLWLLYFIAACVWASYNNDWADFACTDRNRAGVAFGFFTIFGWWAHSVWLFMTRSSDAPAVNATA